MRWLLPMILLLAVASATSALARKWSSRSGGFSVEAELVDVRDGNAVLKKDDGTEISIPLSKLSLADIRYVEGVFKSAEAGLGMKSEGNSGLSNPAAVPAVPDPSAGRTPSAKTKSALAKPSGSKRLLRYDWKPEQTFTYRAKTEVQLGTGPEEVQGTIHYTVQSVSPEGVAEITFSETLTRLQKGAVISSTPRYSVPLRPLHLPHSRYRYPGHFSFGSVPNSPEVVKVDRYGQIVSMEGGAHFPYFLGRAAHLPFEPLSKIEENPWTVATDIAFRMSKVDWLPASILASIRREELPGREKTIFTIDRFDPKQTTINKVYEATSAVQVNGNPQIVLRGEGKQVFDPSRGLFSLSKMKLRVAMYEGAVLTEVPVQVSYELVSLAEETQMKADAEKAKIDRDKLVKDLTRPLTVADLDQIVKDLQSDDHMKASTAKSRLTIKRSKEPDRKMAVALERLLTHENGTVRSAAAAAFSTWATKEDTPTLIKLLDSESMTVRSNALQALGRLKATTAIDRIIQQLPEDQFVAVMALNEMGSAAEPAALKLLTQGDRAAREQACQILQQVGTKKSLPALEKVRKSENDSLMRLSTEQAIQAIEHRK